MNEENLKTAIAEAERFLKAAKAVKWERRPVTSPQPFHYIWADTTKTAAAKRASMDLTRALAQMRKPL